MNSLLKDNVYRGAHLASEQRQRACNKMKVSSVAAAVTALVCMATAPSYASDIEIYVSGTNAQGATTIMFLLDISGSMNTRSIEQDYGNICSRSWGSAVFEGDATNGYYCTASGSEITDQIKKDCEKSGNNYKCYDRISRLRQGMLAVLEGNAAKNVTQLSDDLVIGLSTLGAYTTTYYDTGAVKVPARALKDIVPGTTKTQRALLVEEVKKLRGQTNTPTTRSYAEVVAYLMKTTTKVSGGEWYFGGTYNRQNINAECITMTETGKCLSWGDVYYGSVPNDFTKGISATVKGFTGNVYTANNAYSGFDYSTDTAKNGAKTLYAPPTTITNQLNLTDEEKTCSGQGIYVLTDGVPNYGNGTSGLIKKALGSKASGFSCTDSDSGWDCTHKLAEAILQPARNPANISFKTAVVGFGSEFNSISSAIQTEAEVNALTGIDADVKEAAKWGIKGKGGWYSGSNADDVAISIEDFVKKSGATIPSVSTGSSTIPVDALNPEAVQGFAYFPQFEPKVASSNLQQIWFGNLKKYYVLNNSVYASKAGGSTNVVTSKGIVRDISDIWAKSGFTYADNTPIYQKGGALSQLILGTTINAKGEKVTGRNLLTDYAYDETKPVGQKEGRDYNLVKINYTYTTDAKTKKDNKYAKALMAVLGYNISDAENTDGLDLSSRAADVRQIGSILHSLPVLLTQEGKLVAKNKDTTGKTVFVDSEYREDYVLFGTAQGMVHVVDADTGIEKFTFLPKEMLQKQPETLRSGGGNLTGGKNALYYGMDGEWTAHSIYVSNEDGTLTVRGSKRNVVGAFDKDGKPITEDIIGKQWAYGGMRMGGRSYYALDLTDINNPKIKFHIDPSTGKVFSKAHPEGTEASDAIKNMGQSWSKPKIDYVNWKGQRRLVMFVGGGYDAGGADGDGLFDANGVRTGYAGYEKFNYKQENSTSTKKQIGSGVYMFDADTGELLWNADSTTNPALKYSVASSIKTVDRNNDGIIDHLYFGDLAGQAFRVDFKNDGSKTTFTAQVTKILDLHKIDGTSPRFYLPPTFTAHKSAGQIEGGNIVVAAFVSGNKSSPLLATVDSPLATGQTTSNNLVYDAVYAIYDYDIFPDGSSFPAAKNSLGARILSSDLTAGNTKLKLITTTTSVNSNTGAAISRVSGWGGWYYKFDKGIPVKINTTTIAESRNAGIVKGLTPLIAIGGSLYVTMYDASELGTTSKCGAGVKGKSFTKRLCLPTGVCKEDADYTYDLGPGIITLNIGPSDNNGGNTLIVPNPDEVCTGEGCSPCIGAACEDGKKFLSVGGTMRFIPNRWYEKYAKSNSP